jgi:hypothetical protein
LRVQREVSTSKGRVVVPQLVAYWFIGARASVATLGERMWTDALDRVARAGGNRWAYVLLQTDASAGEAAALAQMEEVLRQTMPTFARP